MVTFDRDAFADGLRTLMYGSNQARFIPAVIARAYDGDFGPAAGFALARARALRGGIAMGILLQIVCAEDISRITPGEIDAATRGTFIGRARVDTQMAACREWPTTPVERVRRPMRSSVPVLLMSGDYDPVTPAQWADSAARHFDRSLRIHLPAGHSLAGPCTDAVLARFFAAGTTDGLDTSCVADVRLPPFATRAELERMFPASR
jgi:pimeloyl-ACP methyl ester carboxylesterase